MSIMGMRTKMSKYFKGLMIAIAVTFVIGFVGMSVGGGRMGPKQPGQETGVLARVNGEKLMWEDFRTALQRQTQQYEQAGQLNPPMEIRLRGQIFDELVDQATKVQAAKDEGIRVSRGDVRKKIDEYTDMQMKQLREQALTGRKQKTDKVFEAQLASMQPGMTIAKKRAEIRSELQKYTDEIRNSVLIERLDKKVSDAVVVNDRTLQESFEQVPVSQITVASTGKRSDAQAKARADEIVGKLKKGEDFATLAKQSSDDMYKISGGNRGPVSRFTIETELRDAAFKTKPGEISSPIKTPQGYVIVKPNGAVVRNLPGDFNDPKKKAQYLTQFGQQARDMAKQEFYAKIQKNAKIEVYDPEMKAYVALKNTYQGLMGMSESERRKAVEKIIAMYQNAAAQSAEDTSLQARCYIQIASLYGMLQSSPMFGLSKEDKAKNAKLARGALESALVNTEDKTLRLALAKMDIEAKDYKAAEENLSIASENAYDEAQSHEAIRDMYKEMKRPDLAAKEQKWIDEFNKTQGANGSTAGPVTTQPIRVPAGGQ